MTRRTRRSRAQSPDRPSTSVTGLATYEICPKQYYYTNIVPLRPPFQRALDRGTNIHSILEDLLRGNSIPGVDQLETWARPYLSNFLISRFSLATPLYVEKPFRLELPGGSISGRIDSVFESRDGGGASWEIVDFKSGRVETREACLAKLQGKLYALAAQELWKVQRVTWSYFYLADGSIHSFDLDPVAAADAAARAGRAMEGIKAERWEPTPGCTCWVCRLSPQEIARGEAYWKRRRPRKSAKVTQPPLTIDTMG
jgi:DNA helicase-2/ATP-dependent DNA helicase PcrA